MSASFPSVVFVDVDDTLIRTVGTKRIPSPNVVEHVRQLRSKGSRMFCWSTGGADYAREVAAQLGLADCFEGYLPKPTLMIDDQPVSDWRYCSYLHPANC